MFSIMTHLKVALFNAIGNYSGVVHLLNCYGTLMFHKPGLLRTRERRIIWFFFPSPADEALLRSAHVPAHKELII